MWLISLIELSLTAATFAHFGWQGIPLLIATGVATIIHLLVGYLFLPPGTSRPLDRDLKRNVRITYWVLFTVLSTAIFFVLSLLGVPPWRAVQISMATAASYLGGSLLRAFLS